ncbi:dioxygenase family protein [Paragemmobacter ruber]|uniref:Intradiol ring-cleavage dioxygenase n=1 Tax=Paragemmobacter ruber TaxID=1985673 RepID=A0ABW9Y5H2_9RHOB|nr:intradiol ring-cleavage dioxygenase [Rhodobacter ruber]NBE07813.1 intradiol ring-cleavage dioxygenase [Rhodobacter ruber]
MRNLLDDDKDHDHAHPEGLRADLPRLLLGRRAVLAGVVGSGAALALIGPRVLAQGVVTGAAADGAVCVAQPAEMAGPFPADGTNVRAGQVVNILTERGVIREDIRSSIGGLRPVAAGVPMRLDLRLVDVRRGCAPLEGHAVYLWQCDAAGVYSIYGAADRTYLRGVAISDSGGRVRMLTVVPGTYPGRWPHLHFEVFASAAAAVDGAAALLTGQFAMPEEACRVAYRADPAYAASRAALDGVRLDRDGIFRNGTAAERAAQMLRLTGDASGFVATGEVGLVV